MIEVTALSLLPDAACEFRFILSGGPGGQHVNKTSSGVELRVDIAQLNLAPMPLQRLQQAQGKRISKSGVLVVQASAHRSQHKNKQDAISRVERMLAAAFTRPKVRIATKPSNSADLRAAGLSAESIYIAAAKAQPNIVFAEYDAAEDAVQKFFLSLGGQDNVSLLKHLKANHADVSAAVSNFRSFIGGGETHTVLAMPEFYTWAADGVARLF